MLIYKKLIILLLAVIVIITSAVIFLGWWGSDRYQQELTQQLHLNTANYIQSHLSAPLIDAQGKANVPLLKDVAMHAMMINPLVEIYLLDVQGKILGHALHTDDIVRSHVDVQPIKYFINTNKTRLVKGDNPRSEIEKQIFSVTPLVEKNSNANNSETTVGYLYVILASQQFDKLSQDIGPSYILRWLLLSFFALVIVLSIIGSYGFYKITRPLKKLQQRVQKFQFEESMQGALMVGSLKSSEESVDEIQGLESTFIAMQKRIEQQFNDLKQTDSLRRELFANISHDLRTPVASIQGYIEILLVKYDQINLQDRKNYLTIALKNCQRLTQLIGAVFELAKLDSKGVKPQLETFSLSELAQDIVHQYELISAQKSIELTLKMKEKDIYINADIGLIERVFQNLIDNAIKFSAAGGKISVELSLQSLQQQEKVRVAVIDKGSGIASHELPYLFDRYYQARSQPIIATNKNLDNNAKVGAGLGLAITKRILELHGSIIEVTSQINNGSEFNFSLPVVFQPRCGHV